LKTLDLQTFDVTIDFVYAFKHKRSIHFWIGLLKSIIISYPLIPI